MIEFESCVVIGSGSAGRRHAIALRRALPETQIIVVQRPGSLQPIAPFVEVGARIVRSLDEALSQHPALGVVASPAPFHLSAAQQMFATGIAVLVEKPLADTVPAAQAIVGCAHDGGGVLVVGYHLRFGDTVPELKRLLTAGVVGEATGFRLAVGQHLDQWRPGIDPRDSVTARRDLGGGVLLELSHELDGARYLFGEMVDVSARLERGGAPTDGLVETIAEVKLRTQSGISGEVHLDMIAAVPFRLWEVNGTAGTLRADLLSGEIELEDHAGARTIVTAGLSGERDRAEDRLIANLIAAANGDESPRCTGADGVAAVTMVEAAKQSDRTGRPVVVTSP